MYQEVFQLHSDLLKALAHPKRLEIVHLLRDQTLNVTQIQTMLDLPQANLSQHLSVLRQKGIVVCKKEGKQIQYRLAHQNFILASDLLRLVLIEKYSNSKIVEELSIRMTDLVPLALDPVCGMRLSPKTAAFAYKYDGKTHYFCAAGCFGKFKKNPLKFICTKNK
ncbi:MAG: Regulatory protein ArsR [Candidatus Collierbacteria bacterium GW2011_GWF2_44_15]|uniref:Regulatory protein ArsR n=3 Tax=Candidatus Collieribacteriota TaxID=1752725 RepID=A0A0G1KEU5_9BACT|nr:MAG: Regulatory protein ArsR [Candidatus Collierbacteria bacterium GW2011_GWF2_44_15]KKT99186.1 MAG: Regulatory protein ArsR [Candidatus Collierbacteria bacterium GW2011_GWC2_45_15]